MVPGADEHGVRMHSEGEALRFTWGGRDLLIVERELIANDELSLDEEDLHQELYYTDVPDAVPDDWTG